MAHELMPWSPAVSSVISARMGSDPCLTIQSMVYYDVNESNDNYVKCTSMMLHASHEH